MSNFEGGILVSLVQERWGGSLGSFTPGTMMKEFDEVILFTTQTNIGEIVVGPVQTKFGYHHILIVVDKRTGV